MLYAYYINKETISTSDAGSYWIFSQTRLRREVGDFSGWVILLKITLHVGGQRVDLCRVVVAGGWEMFCRRELRGLFPPNAPLFPTAFMYIPRRDSPA